MNFSDSLIILWKFNNSPDQSGSDIFMDTEGIESKESWTFYKALR